MQRRTDCWHHHVYCFGCGIRLPSHSHRYVRRHERQCFGSKDYFEKLCLKFCAVCLSLSRQQRTCKYCLYQLYDVIVIDINFDQYFFLVVTYFMYISFCFSVTRTQSLDSIFDQEHRDELMSIGIHYSWSRQRPWYFSLSRTRSLESIFSKKQYGVNRHSLVP